MAMLALAPRRVAPASIIAFASSYELMPPDALTSILAITALLFGKYRGWNFMDPVMGIVGAVVISRWSYGLMRETGKVLLTFGLLQRRAAMRQRMIAIGLPSHRPVDKQVTRGVPHTLEHAPVADTLLA